MKSFKLKKIIRSEYLYLTLFIIVSLLAALIPYFKIDLFLTENIQSINSPFFSKLMWLISSIGNQPTMVFLVAIAGVTLFLLKQRTEAVFSTLAAAGSALSGSLIKTLIDRPRPSPNLVHVSVWLSDKSFPSNHVLVFTVFFGFLLYLLLKKLRGKILGLLLIIIFSLLIASIGISRIYLGVHWASDVLGGYLLGVIWLLFIVWLYNSYHGKR